MKESLFVYTVFDGARLEVLIEEEYDLQLILSDYIE